MPDSLPTANPTQPIEKMATGAWTRLRNVLVTLDRVDRLETCSEFSGWLPALMQDQASLERMLREFVLRVLRLAADPTNARILSELHRSDALTVGALMTRLQLERVELSERLNELARVGLTVQGWEGENIQPTLLAQGFLALVDAIVAQMQAQALRDTTLMPSRRSER